MFGYQSIGTPAEFERRLQGEARGWAAFQGRRNALARRIEQAPATIRAEFIALCVSLGSTPDDAEYQAPLADHISEAARAGLGDDPTNAEFDRLTGINLTTLETWATERGA